MIEQVHEAAIGQNVVGQKELGVVGDAAEAPVDDRIVMAPGRDKNGELLCHLGVVIKKFHEAPAHLFLHPRNASLSGFIHDDRGPGSVSVGKHRLAKIVLLQDSYGTETVEPSVGSLLADILDADPLNAFVKRHPPVVETLRLQLSVPQRAALHEPRLVLFRHISILVKAKREHLGGDASLQYIPRLGREAFDSVCVHIYLNFRNRHTKIYYLLLIRSTSSLGVRISIFEKPNHFLPKSLMDAPI